MTAPVFLSTETTHEGFNFFFIAFDLDPITIIGLNYSKFLDNLFHFRSL